MISVRWNSNLSREVVRRPQRDDAERDVKSIEAVDHFVHRSVASSRDHDVHASFRRRGGDRERFARLERGMWLDVMPLLSHPIDEMANVGPVSAGAVNDQYDVFGSHALD
jgi:hypothetical protein